MRNKMLKSVSMERIRANPFQPRKEFEEEDMLEMVKSIKEHGVIQPVLVRKLNDEYQLVAGERRLRAAREAGLEEIPAVEIEAEGIEIAELSLAENLQRKDLNPVEESEAYSMIVDKFRLTQEELAKRLGKSRSYIANVLRVKNLPEDIKRELMKNRISFGHAKAIMGIENDLEKNEVCKAIIDKGLNVRQTEKLVMDTGKTKEGKSKKKGLKIKKVFKDARIFFNEIKGVVGKIKEAGGKAEIMDKETEDYFEIVVRIPKGKEE